MDCIEIIGGRPLHGEVSVQGSKNGALPILAGAVLHKGITVLHNCPKILDVMYMIQILQELGCQVWWQESSLYIDASRLSASHVSAELGEKMRSSVILMGSLLGRVGEAWIPYPGGCVIGARPVDIHIDALQKMQVYVEESEGLLHVRTEGIKGDRVRFKYPSVGATENIILAAVLGEGVTEIQGGAIEPEIIELCGFLNSKGAKIDITGDYLIRIEGVSELLDSEYKLMPDRIVAGTYLMAAVATRGCISLRNVPVGQLTEVLKILQQMGAWIEYDKAILKIDASRADIPVKILETMPYPGFPTDLQSPLMAALCLANGRSHIIESVFEARFKAAGQLNRMGARITIDGQEAIIDGVAALKGVQVIAPELRGGAALVIAGLAAEGQTQVLSSHFIDRGYEDISRDFRLLGADIRRKNIPEEK